MSVSYQSIKCGDYVCFETTGTDVRRLYGTVKFIHPSNRWMTVLVDKVAVRGRVMSGGKGIWTWSDRPCGTPYLTSASFDEVRKA